MGAREKITVKAKTVSTPQSSHDHAGKRERDVVRQIQYRKRAQRAVCLQRGFLLYLLGQGKHPGPLVSKLRCEERVVHNPLAHLHICGRGEDHSEPMEWVRKTLCKILDLMYLIFFSLVCQDIS